MQTKEISQHFIKKSAILEQVIYIFLQFYLQSPFF